MYIIIDKVLAVQYNVRPCPRYQAPPAPSDAWDLEDWSCTPVAAVARNLPSASTQGRLRVKAWGSAAVGQNMA